MHDFYLAKEIYDLILRYAHRNKLKRIESVEIEIGSIQGKEHPEDIAVKNLRYNLKMMARGSIAEKSKFSIKKVRGEGYKLVSIKGRK